MIRKCYRSICGYVRICVSGKNARRFLNICAKQGIRLWKIKRTEQEDEYTCYLFKRDVYAIKPVLKKTDTHFRICEKKGLGFQLFRYRKRSVFLLSFLAVFMLFSYNAGFIWKIEIKGNSCLSEETVIEYLKEKERGFGTRKKEVDCEELELSFRKDFSEVIWASVYMEGTKLVVELQENLISVTPEDAGLDKDGCYDLVAAKDAVIASIVTRSGVPKVTSGSEVKAGDLLVGGRQEILDDNGEVGSLYFATADADIFGIVTYEYTKEFPKREVLQIPTGQTKTGYFAAIGEKKLVFPTANAEFSHVRELEEYEQLHFTNNFYLPVFWGRITYEEYEQRPVTHQREEIRMAAAEDFMYYLVRLQENGVQILEKQAVLTEEKNVYRLTGTVTACEPIAIYVPTVITN